MSKNNIRDLKQSFDDDDDIGLNIPEELSQKGEEGEMHGFGLENSEGEPIEEEEIIADDEIEYDDAADDMLLDDDAE